MRGLTERNEAASLAGLNTILDLGGDPNLQDNSGQTVFHILARRSRFIPKKSDM